MVSKEPVGQGNFRVTKYNRANYTALNLPYNNRFSFFCSSVGHKRDHILSRSLFTNRKILIAKQYTIFYDPNKYGHIIFLNGYIAAIELVQSTVTALLPTPNLGNELNPSLPRGQGGIPLWLSRLDAVLQNPGCLGITLFLVCNYITPQSPTLCPEYCTRSCT